MAKYSKSAQSSKGNYRSINSSSYKDRNLAAMKPEKAQEQLKPTEAEPVNLHKRMAGCS